MEVFQVSISDGGIPNRSVGTAEITQDGLVGDTHDNPDIHGGPDQAVLIIPLNVYEKLNLEGYDVVPGDLGENLTIQDLWLKDMAPGDRYRVGPEVELEITMERKPCATLEPLDERFPKGLLGRGGYYAKVLQVGTVQEGDTVEKIEPDEGDAA